MPGAYNVESPSSKMPNIVIDGSFFRNNQTGFMSPQPLDPRVVHDFYPLNPIRVASPMPASTTKSRKKEMSRKTKASNANPGKHLKLSKF